MSGEARSRIQIFVPPAPVAVKASRFPSGDMAKGCRVIDGANMVPAGAGISNCTTCRGACAAGRCNRHRSMPPPSNRASRKNKLQFWDFSSQVTNGEAAAALEQLREEPALRSYHLLPSVRGDLLERLGRTDEARAEFERAASLAQNVRERELLLGRARACGGKPDLSGPRA